MTKLIAIMNAKKNECVQIKGVYIEKTVIGDYD